MSHPISNCCYPINLSFPIYSFNIHPSHYWRKIIVSVLNLPTIVVHHLLSCCDPYIYSAIASKSCCTFWNLSSLFFVRFCKSNSRGTQDRRNDKKSKKLNHQNRNKELRKLKYIIPHIQY